MFARGASSCFNPNLFKIIRQSAILNTSKRVPTKAETVNVLFSNHTNILCSPMSSCCNKNGSVQSFLFYKSFIPDNYNLIFCEISIIHIDVNNTDPPSSVNTSNNQL